LGICPLLFLGSPPEGRWYIRSEPAFLGFAILFGVGSVGPPLASGSTSTHYFRLVYLSSLYIFCRTRLTRFVCFSTSESIYGLACFLTLFPEARRGRALAQGFILVRYFAASILFYILLLASRVTRAIVRPVACTAIAGAGLVLCRRIVGAFTLYHVI
jgi:hypothetical protein